MNAISSVRLNLAAERQENLIVFFSFYYMEGLHFCYKKSKTLKTLKAHLTFCNPDLVFSQ